MEDEDDIPIAELMRRRALEKAAAQQPSQPPPQRAPPVANSVPAAAAPQRRSIVDNDDDDEDDVPIAELMRRKALANAATAKPSPAKSVQAPIKIKLPKDHVKEEKTDKNEKKEKKEKERDRDRQRDRERQSSKHEDRHKSSSVVAPKASSSSSKTKSGVIYDESTKGALVQKLLVRWWYAIEWPNPADIDEAPSGYEALHGFPGVFVSTTV
jgi:phage pi2 protein 07